MVLAIAHAFSLFAAISSSMHVSGGHINPAVTFGALLGGRISVLRALYYWVAQLLGSFVAALLLRLVTNNMVYNILISLVKKGKNITHFFPASSTCVCDLSSDY